MAQKIMVEFLFVLFGGRLSMSFDDSTSDSTVTRRHFVFVLGRDEAFILRFRAAANLRRGPEPWAKISRGLF